MDLLNDSYDYGRSPLTPASRKQQHHLYLFGHGISYSLSPSINNALFGAAKIPWNYSIRETTSPEHFLKVLRQSTTIGASITIPNKVAFLPLLDDLTPEARAIGAVNTVFVRHDSQGHRRYIGANTDCVGIREALLARIPRIGETSKSSPALVLGAGGAARSAIYALWTWFGPSEVYLVNRFKAETDELITSFGSSMQGLNLRHVTAVEDALRLPPPRIIIGTVPDAPPGTPEENLAWRIAMTFLDRKSPEGAVLDMCYNPPRTNLIKAAEAMGWARIVGTEVLLRVNLAQQVLWTEQNPAEDGIRAARVVLSRVSKL